MKHLYLTMYERYKYTYRAACRFGWTRRQALARALKEAVTKRRVRIGDILI